MGLAQFYQHHVRKCIFCPVSNGIEVTMRQLLVVSLVILALSMPYSALSSKSNKPVKATTPLSADEMAVYKTVLQIYNGDKDANLNVSITTYPLDPDSPTSGLDQLECLKGTQLENLSTVSHTYH
jgi:hypothetical protein